MFEALESRRVFSTDFAYVGLQYPEGDAPVMIVWGEGTRNDAGGITGTSNSLTWGGTLQSSATDIESMSFNNGGMTLVYSGDQTVDSVYGADFRMGAGYTQGFFGAAGSNGKDARFFVEQRSHDMIWSGQYYNFTITRLSAEGLTTINASLRFTFPPGTRPPSPAYDPIGAFISYNGGAEETRTVTSITADGVITLNSGEILYFTDNSNQHTAPMSYLDLSQGDPRTGNFMYVDPNATDGAIGVGIGSLENTLYFPNNMGLDGVYRGSVFANNAQSLAFFKNGDIFPGPTSAEFVLVLYHGGDYELFDPANYSSQTPDAFRHGTWAADTANGDVVLTDSEGTFSAKFRVSPTRSFSAVSLTSTNAGQSTTTALTGGLSQFVGTYEDRYASIKEVSLQNDGSVEVVTFLQGNDGTNATYTWTRYDLQDRAGGFALTKVLHTEHPYITASKSLARPSHGQDLITGIDTRGHVVSYERTYSGDWTYRDITQELSVAPLESGTTAFDFWRFDGLNETSQMTVPQHLVPVLYGVDENGTHVAFRPYAGYNVSRHLTFERLDLSAALTGTGSAAPDFSGGSITGFSSPWGSINIIGLNAEGHVEALWTSPGFGWYVNDLTEAAGGSAMTGTLTANFTTWHALNVFGLDETGHIDVLWWTPANGAWVASDLTSEFDLTPMRTTGTQQLVNISNYDYGAIAVGGYTAEGEVVMYWWAVGQNGWQETNLTAMDPQGRAPATLIEAGHDSTGYGTEQFVWGREGDGDLVRYAWNSTTGDPWKYENITQIALAQ
jgi:hypothetical protein